MSTIVFDYKNYSHVWQTGNLVAQWREKDVDASSTPKSPKLKLKNRTNIRLRFNVMEKSRQDYSVKAMDEKIIDMPSEHKRIIVTSEISGAFVSAFYVDYKHDSALIDPMRTLTPPNQIGPPPGSNNKAIIPSPPPPVIVGISQPVDGFHKKDKDKGTKDQVIVREQFWSLSSSSLGIAPNEKRTISTTHTTGRIESAIQTNSTTASISSTASAGWGPISATVSGSLSANSSSSQQLNIEETNTSYSESIIHNTSNKSQNILFWKLVERITWHKISTGEIKSCIDCVIGPAIPMSTHSE